MFSKISVRGGALRAYGSVARRPTEVMGVQSQLRCLSLAAAPIQARPQLQELQKLRPITQSSTFATKATKEPKEPKEPKARTPKAATAKGENAQKAQKPITKTQKLIQARQHMKDLKATALQPPARLPSTARHLCLSSIMNELNKASGSRSERLKAAHVKYSELTSSELEVRVNGFSFTPSWLTVRYSNTKPKLPRIRLPLRPPINRSSSHTPLNRSLKPTKPAQSSAT